MVSDILLPFVSLLPFISKNMPQKFLVLRRGPNGKGGYNTIDQAEADGAVTMAYGYGDFHPLPRAIASDTSSVASSTP